MFSAWEGSTGHDLVAPRVGASNCGARELERGDVDRVGYREQLRTVVAASAAPYGYTLTLWTAGAVTAHAESGLPTAWDAVLLLAGAVVGFGAVGTYAAGGLNEVLAPGAPARVRVWGGMHLPSVGLSILLVASLNAVLDGPVVWPLVGFTATTCYLLVIGLQFWLATHRGDPTEAQGDSRSAR